VTKEQCSICGIAYINGTQACNCNAGPQQPLSSNERVLAAPLKDFNGTKYHICDAEGRALCNGLETTAHLRMPACQVEHSRCNRKACRMNYPDLNLTNVVMRHGNP
jgi:hypothetical protein